MGRTTVEEEDEDGGDTVSLSRFIIQSLLCVGVCVWLLLNSSIKNNYIQHIIIIIIIFHQCHGSVRLTLTFRLCISIGTTSTVVPVLFRFPIFYSRRMLKPGSELDWYLKHFYVSIFYKR